MEAQPDLDKILDRIRAFRIAAVLSYSALAQRAGLSRAALIGMDSKQWGPTSTTIRAVTALIPHNWHPGSPLPAPRQPRKKAA